MIRKFLASTSLNLRMIFLIFLRGFSPEDLLQSRKGLLSVFIADGRSTYPPRGNSQPVDHRYYTFQVWMMLLHCVWP